VGADDAVRRKLGAAVAKLHSHSATELVCTDQATLLEALARKAD
jgi:hypothetical protein